MTKKVEKKLKQLPKTPGVYFYKNAVGEIIYVGKASRLKNRVLQYFQTSRPLDTKTQLLVNDIADMDWIEVGSEIDALFLEAEQIRRYLPKYNIMLRDDKSYVYIRIDIKSEYPSVWVTRRPLDDKAEYIGPFASAFQIRRALKYLRRAFPYSTHFGQTPTRACLQAHLGLCPNLEEPLAMHQSAGSEAGPQTPQTSLHHAKLSSAVRPHRITDTAQFAPQREVSPGTKVQDDRLQAYRADLRKLMRYLRGEKQTLVKEIEKDMNRAAKTSEFEMAAKMRDQLTALKNLEQQVIFGDREFMDVSRDHALKELAELLKLEKPPKRIEGFDISHHSGTDTTASMVVFTYGLPDKTNYRKFKLRIPGNDDFAHMNEALTRRLSPTNVKAWDLPDLFLIDGGKGQVNAALNAQQQVGLQIPMIGLAKRFETIIVPQKMEDGRWKMEEVSLPQSSNLIKLLMRIRDESHRFAVSYHSTLKGKRQTASSLDEIPGIGPATRKKLIRHFGSLKALTDNDLAQIAKVIGVSKAILITKHLSNQ